MQNFHSQIPSEPYIQNLFKDEFSIILKKIPENGGIYGKKPDFEYLEDDVRIFVCELKEIELPKFPDQTAKETGWKKDESNGGFIRDWNQSSLISYDINQAYKQLKHFTEPKIVIFLNRNYFFGVKDLIGTINGYIVDDKGKRIPDNYYRSASEGKIKNIKNKIDLYIWIDAAEIRYDQLKDNIFIRYTTSDGENMSKRYFTNQNENNN